MNFKKFESKTKLRGGYYTPLPVASFLSRWILAKNPNLILEPGCGSGYFIEALSKNTEHTLSFHGIELDSCEAHKAKKILGEAPFIDGDIFIEDFLSWALKKMEEGYECDAVLGNPPYIRYQYIEKNIQSLSQKIFSKFDLKFTKHTNIWVTFIIASVFLLKGGGRIGMVIPSEIMHVIHATELRRFLLHKCKKILLIDPNELLFAEALQGTVLLMAEKKNGLEDSEGVAIVSAKDNSFLNKDPGYFFENALYLNGEHLNGKWMKALLSSEELDVFERFKKNKNVVKFGNIASADVGIVTGANKFFLVTDKIVEEFNLHKWAFPMFGRSEHVAGIIYDESQHKENEAKGLPTNFLWFDQIEKNSLPEKVKEYIEIGERQELNKRYKCRIRKPWYRVPSVYPSEIGMLKRCHHYPRLILNSYGALTTDTAYRIKTLNTSPDKLVYCFVNSFTALTAELEGRHYGGGVLELVPSEIDNLLIPLPPDIHYDVAALDKRMREEEDFETLFLEQDKFLLASCGLSIEECEIIQRAWSRIRSRRQRSI